MFFGGSATRGSFGPPMGYGQASPQTYNASPQGYADDGYPEEYDEEEGQLLSKNSPYTRPTHIH